jgi:hypothetical protein
MATLEKVTEELLNDLQKFSSQVARKIGSDLHTITLDRIFTEGIASNGQKIGTYSPGTISIKKKKGRFTSKQVNLRDTETLVNSYKFETKGDLVELGFIKKEKDGVSNSKKVKDLKEKYGDIFGLTDKEKSFIDDIAQDFLDKKIN